MVAARPYGCSRSTAEGSSESATVNDLQMLDGNAQVYQQLSSLDTDLDDDSSNIDELERMSERRFRRRPG